MLVMTLVRDEVVDIVNNVANNDADDIADEFEVIRKVVGVSVEELSKAGLVFSPCLSLATKGLE